MPLARGGKFGVGEAEERASKECVPAIIIADDLQGKPRKRASVWTRKKETRSCRYVTLVGDQKHSRG